MRRKSVLLVAGEVSGDMHAAALVRAILRRNPDIDFFGIGGECLRRAGMDILYDTGRMAVLGLAEVLARFWFFKRIFDRMVSLIRERNPDAVLLVDYPGFNLRLAARAHAMGKKVIYYICPQVWAWNRGRIPRMARIVDRLIAIFPFEQEVFKGSGLRVDFVGHPLVDSAREALAAPLEDLPWGGEPRVALLPGSRAQEVRRILPAMWAAAGMIEKRHPDAAFIIASPSEEIAGLAKAMLATESAALRRWSVVTGRTSQVLRQARAGWVASGTATLETALMRCPMVVVYKTAPLTYALGKRLIKVPYLGMVNVLAGKKVCPELIQGQARPEALADAIEPLLGESAERDSMLNELKAITARLGEGGAAERAAGVVLEELG